MRGRSAVALLTLLGTHHPFSTLHRRQIDPRYTVSTGRFAICVAKTAPSLYLPAVGDDVTGRSTPKGVLLNLDPAFLRRVDAAARDRAQTRTAFVREAARVSVEAAEAHRALRKGGKALAAVLGDLERAEVPRVASTMRDGALRGSYEAAEPAPAPPPAPPAPAPQIVVMQQGGALEAKADLLTRFILSGKNAFEAKGNAHIVEVIILAGEPDVASQQALAKAIDDRLAQPVAPPKSIAQKVVGWLDPPRPAPPRISAPVPPETVDEIHQRVFGSPLRSSEE